MKKFLIFPILTGLLLFFTACSSSKTLVNPEKVQRLITAKEFSFHAERANPVGMDAINVLSSMKPNSSQILNLDPGYTADFQNNKITLHLPYFGRVFMPSLDPSKNGYDMTLDKFAVNASKSKPKKAVFIYNITSGQNISTLILEIYPNGRAYLSIDANDRQPISYDGYIGDLPKLQ